MNKVFILSDKKINTLLLFVWNGSHCIDCNILYCVMTILLHSFLLFICFPFPVFHFANAGDGEAGGGGVKCRLWLDSEKNI